MSGLPLEPEHGGDRYPGFDVLGQAPHWDDATRAVVERRLGMQPAVRFFSDAEWAAAGALFDQLLYQRSEPRVPIVQLVDARLAEDQTDGWHYADMEPDGRAWHSTLAYLDEDSTREYGTVFADRSWSEQSELLTSIHELGSSDWHGIIAARAWSLWTRYACTAFYSHPWAWQEIGFAGPAYPRGYKNIGVDRLEPFEVRDARPSDDPLKGRVS